MEIPLTDLPETNKSLYELEPHIGDDGNGLGFKDKDGQFKIVVMDGEKMYKKRISKRHLS